jgi:hypothetical protein
VGLFRRRAADSPLEDAALSAFVESLDGDARAIAEAQVAAIRKRQRFPGGRDVILRLDDSAPRFPLTRSATAATVTLRADDDTEYSVDVDVYEGRLFELFVKPPPARHESVSVVGVVSRVDVSREVAHDDRGWFVNALPVRLPHDYLELADGLEANGVVVFSLTDIRRVPLGVDDDFFALGEIEATATYFGVRAGDQPDDPPLYAMRHDDPGAAQPVGKRLSQLLAR